MNVPGLVVLKEARSDVIRYIQGAFPRVVWSRGATKKPAIKEEHGM